jgi:hypothetical protein
LFQPYYNTWTTVHTWLTEYPKWNNDQWANVDALFAEKFVEDGSKALGLCIRAFREKDEKNNYEKILALVLKSKAEIDAFRKKVPL